MKASTMVLVSYHRVAVVLTLVNLMLGFSECLSTSHSKGTSRRNLFSQFAASAAIAVFITTNAQPAFASMSQEEKDKSNIVKGYKRLNYLLDNWDEETTVCKTGNDNPYLGCDRTPVKVMDYLGYRNTEDPLFKADKTMRRLEALVPDDKEGEYLEALDTWIEKAEEGSGMAYISSWGESNPGGGKDRVALFIERSKNDVIACRDSLKTVVRVLNLE